MTLSSIGLRRGSSPVMIIRSLFLSAALALLRRMLLILDHTEINGGRSAVKQSGLERDEICFGVET